MSGVFARRMAVGVAAFLPETVVLCRYLFEWLMTLFTRTLNLELAHRVWDNFLLVGSHFLFRTGLGIIHLLLADIRSLPFEKILQFLNRLPSTVDEEVLFAHIKAVPLTQTDMREALKEAEAAQAQQPKQHRTRVAGPTKQHS